MVYDYTDLNTDTPLGNVANIIDKQHTPNYYRVVESHVYELHIINLKKDYMDNFKKTKITIGELGTIDPTSWNINSETLNSIYIDDPIEIMNTYTEIINGKKDIFKKNKYIKRLLLSD